MWHEISIEGVIKKLNTNPETGLSLEEVDLRTKKFGLNLLPRIKKTPSWLLFLRQFNNPLVIILLVAAVLTAWLKEYTDMSVIMAAVLVNTSIGFYQEFRSSNIFEKLRQIVKVRARVLRDKKIIEVDAEELMPGDIVILKPGIKVPADGRLLSTKSLKVNEAILTGESVPVKKKLGVVAEDASLGDRLNMAFMGTIVEEGEGEMVVTDTAGQTEIGQIAKLTQKAKEIPTPLQERIAHLGRILTIFISLTAIVIFLVGILESRGFVEMFTVTVAVVVAAIPEGLPAALSVVLSVSSQHILRRNGLVKHILAAETLGSANVICTDKTGTLTEGKMKLEQLITEDEKMASQILALANEAVVEISGKGWQVKGDPTDRAKMEFFLEQDMDLEKTLATLPRINFLPFNPNRKYLASFHQIPGKKTEMALVSGAPEALINLSTSFQDKQKTNPLTDSKKKELEEQYEGLAKESYRVIALAYCQFSDGAARLEESEQMAGLIKNMTFVGLAALRDPIRSDVKETIKETLKAGIKVVMVTGDHKLTAEAIGKELGLKTTQGAVIEATELDLMEDEELKNKIKGVEVFARVNPEHKMRIIQAWQANGAAVAMTGDGINDAPALKAADIGVAVGSATDVTKEAADLVLLDNNFSTIVSSIRQGRIAFSNIRKVTIFLLANSFTEIILVISSLILRIPLPITAAQILFANLVEDTLPNFALAFEPGEKDIMERPPIKRKESIIGKEGMVLVFIVGTITNIFLVGIFLIVFFFFDVDLILLRTFIFAALSTDTLIYIFSIKSLRQSIFKTNIFNNHYLLVAVGIGFTLVLSAVYLPFLNNLLRTTPLPFLVMMAVIGLGLLKLTLIELAKWWFRAHEAKAQR